MTGKYFIQTKQFTENIPVIVEQAPNRIIVDVSGNNDSLLKEVYDLLTSNQIQAMRLKNNFGCFLFNKLNNSWNVVYNIHEFYKLFFSFKSKVKGIVKLRASMEHTIVENNKLFSSVCLNLRTSGITWSIEAVTLMRQVLAEQQTRWAKVCAKYSNATVAEKINYFILSATGQKDIYPEEKSLLYFYLEKVLPNHIHDWNYFSVLNENKKPAIVTNELYNKLYFFQLHRNKNDYYIDRLDYLFREIKKPLTNLINLFTTDPKKIKFIQCIK